MPLEFFEYKVNAAVNRWIDDSTPIPNTLIIPTEYRGKPVTEIRPNCFTGRAEIERVIIPATLKAIGAHAFEGCKNLKTISPNPESVHNTLPEALEIIEERAFANTPLSGMLALLGKYLDIHDEAFENAHALKRIVVGSESLKLGKGTFRSCDSLEMVIGNPKLESIPEECFAYCKDLKIMALPFRSVSERGFYLNTRLDTIKPFKKLRSVGQDAFFGCRALKNIPEKWKGSENMKSKTTDDTLVFPENWDDLLDAELAKTEMNPEEREYAILEAVWNDEPVPPLLKLKIKCNDGNPGPIPIRIKGSFRNYSGYKFSVILPASLGAVEFICEDLGNLSGIIDYLAEENCPVYLHGKRVGNYYEVNDIEPTAKSGPLLSKDFFKEMIRRARESVMHEEVSKKKPYYLRTEEEFKAFLAACSATLPPWVQAAAQKELLTLTNSSSKLGDQAAHAKLALEILLNIQWDPPSNLYIPNVDEARRSLDRQFYGMDDVKQPISELLAQMNRTRKLPDEDLLLVGPPGVGKTYIINAISKILQLPVVMLDFSGIGRDPDEITGTNRIYQNAKPGTLLSGYFTHRTSTVILFLNEVDKAVSNGKMGSDVLLSILDGAGMKEGFLEQVIPTDNVLCLATANDLDKLSPPLRSRFRVVHLAPYSSNEKLEIWRNFALPKALENANIAPDELQFADQAEEMLIKQYATEAGVRDVYGYAKEFAKKYCYNVAENPAAKGHIYTAEEVKSILGPSKQICRPFNVHAGSVRFGYMAQGHALLAMLEVSIEKGAGKLEILGAVPPIQKQYVRIAWKAVKQTTSYDLSAVDVTVFFPTPIAVESPENVVGLPVYLGLCSALIQAPLNLADTVIYGSGIDLFGNIYLDSAALTTPFISTMEEEGIRVMYGPTGLYSRFDFRKCNTSPIILESHDGEALVRMVMANNQKRST